MSYSFNYRTYLINGSILQSQMKAEGLEASDLLSENETEQSFNKRMIAEGWAEINENNGTVTFFVDGEGSPQKSNCYITLSSAVDAASKILSDDDLLDDGVDLWDIDNLSDMARESAEEVDGIDTYYCVATDGSIGLTHDNGYNVDWIYRLVEKPDTVLDDVVTISEASEMIGISERGIRFNCESGKYKARKSGNTWLIDKSSLPEPK